MDPGAGLSRVFVHSVSHVDSYNISDRKIKETFLSFAKLAHCCASDSSVVSRHRVLLSVPLEGIDGLPGSVSGVVRMLGGLVGDGHGVALHGIIIQLLAAIVVVVNLAHVDSILHLVSSVTGP